MAVHPSGDHILCGSYDKRLCWWDTDLSTKPHRILRSHTKAIRSVAFHRSYPLCASASDDGAVHVYHSMVFNDMNQNVRIVPVNILNGTPSASSGVGVLQCCYHPTQPWLVTSCADGSMLLWTQS